MSEDALAEHDFQGILVEACRPESDYAADGMDAIQCFPQLTPLDLAEDIPHQVQNF
jgi:hypothetical protein